MKQVVAMCCFCEKVRDDAGVEHGGGIWQEFKSYVAKYQLRPTDVRFSHAYCPSCLSYYRNFLATPQGTSPRSEMEGGA